ncbi:MAG TPA: ATP-binding protein, partial [Terriglobales bacterium]|nr:ATP-binding protein [Terriglobales bacterium]
LDYVNEYIGRYIILIYCSFTLMVGLGTLVIGMIVADADDKLKKQYAELQETQQQLAQSAKLASIGELAGGMAHEINNPITGILALASHMAEGNNAGALNARARRNLEIIVRQTERVAGLVRGLLTFSRQTQLHFEPVCVGDVLDTALDLVRYRLNDGAVRVALDIERGMAPVTADSSRLTEVFVNLLSNALDAMPAGGLLTVRAQSAAAGGVHVEIQDTGEGITPELLARIFDPFFTTKAPGRGTGLGLSISHGIIKDHGGEIWAQSSPGEGTTMTVVLPAETVRNAGAMSYEEARAGH